MQRFIVPREFVVRPSRQELRNGPAGRRLTIGGAQPSGDAGPRRPLQQLVCTLLGVSVLCPSEEIDERSERSFGDDLRRAQLGAVFAHHRSVPVIDLRDSAEVASGDELDKLSLRCEGGTAAHM